MPGSRKSREHQIEIDFTAENYPLRKKAVHPIGGTAFSIWQCSRLIQTVGDEVVDQAGYTLVDGIVEQGVILIVRKYRFR